jgi:hypothetical protein
VARYNADLLPRLVPDYPIDVFVEGRPGPSEVAGLDRPVLSAHDFVWRHLQHPYDLVVYQLGNAPCHDYMWAYLVRYPGCVVLHDGQLHHARARSLLAQRRAEDYREEFLFDHPGVNTNLPEIGIAGRLGSLTYLFPMRRVVVDAARLIVVHNEWLADEIRHEQPDVPVCVVEMGVPAAAIRPGASERIRTRHGIAPDRIVFLALGRATPEKRISQALRAFRSILDAAPQAHLLICGEAAGYYSPLAEAETLGIAERITLSGFVPDQEVDDYLAAADVCLCLRWPAARETSAAWLRCLAAARATIITDLPHTADIPALDPRTWAPYYVPPVSLESSALSMSYEAASVSIDILDEDHSLGLAMRRLAADANLRAALGGEAHALWARRFTLDRMVEGYRAALDAARLAPAPSPASRRDRPPGHFLTDGTEHAARLLRELGLPESRVSAIWQTK